MSLLNILVISLAFSTPAPILPVIVKHFYCNFPNVWGSHMMLCMLFPSSHLLGYFTFTQDQSKCHITWPLCSGWYRSPSLVLSPFLFVPSPGHLFCCFVTAPSRSPREDIFYSHIHSFVHNTGYIVWTQYIFLE